METQATKPRRLAAIDALPTEMQNDVLLDWQTVADIIGSKDPEYTRELITKAGVPLVAISARRKLPRWGDLRAFLRSRETTAA